MWKIVATLVLLVATGVVTYVTALIILMGLGTKIHGNYEYYGSYSALVFLFGLAAIGFAVPGVVTWYLHKREHPWQFSLFTLLVASTLIAVVLGIGVSFFSWLWQPSV